MVLYLAHTSNNLFYHNISQLNTKRLILVTPCILVCLTMVRYTTVDVTEWCGRDTQLWKHVCQLVALCCKTLQQGMCYAVPHLCCVTHPCEEQQHITHPCGASHPERNWCEWIGFSFTNTVDGGSTWGLLSGGKIAGALRCQTGYSK